MDDQQRARELRKQAAKILGDAYNAAYFFGAADDALSDTPSPHCQVTITAITAALRATPEGFVVCPEDPSASMIRAGLLFGLTPNQACTIYQSMLAARPQGEKDA